MPGIGIEKLPDLGLLPAEARWVTLNVHIPPEAAASAGPGAHEIHFQIAQLAQEASAATPGKRALMSPDAFPGFLLSAQPCWPASRGRSCGCRSVAVGHPIEP